MSQTVRLEDKDGKCVMTETIEPTKGCVVNLVTYDGRSFLEHHIEVTESGDFTYVFREVTAIPLEELRK